MNQNKELIKQIVSSIEADVEDEELIEFLLKKKIAISPHHLHKQVTFSQRASDAIAKFVGSWLFVFSFLFFIFLWMLLNIFILSSAFDPYPFILLNLILSCIAAIQAPLIMMSQNRQEEKDRTRAENDYKVNLKTEIVIEDLHYKIDHLEEQLEELKQLLEKK